MYSLSQSAPAGLSVSSLSSSFASFMTSRTSPSAVSGVTESFVARDFIWFASARCSVASCCAYFFTAGLVAFFAASWLSRTSPALAAPTSPKIEASVHPPRLTTLPAADSIRRAAVSAAAPTRLVAVSTAAPTRLAVVSAALSAAARSCGLQAQSVRTTAAVPPRKPFVPNFMGPPFFRAMTRLNRLHRRLIDVQNAFFQGVFRLTSLQHGEGQQRERRRASAVCTAAAKSVM